MNLAIGVLVSSTVFLLIQIILYSRETKRGERIFLSRFRSWCDRQVLKIHYGLTHVSIHWGSGAMRIAFHYVVHQVLRVVIGFVSSIEKGLSKLQSRNRQVAKKVRTNQDRNHLDLIAEHKANVALSEDEKQERKERAIEST